MGTLGWIALKGGPPRPDGDAAAVPCVGGACGLSETVRGPTLVGELDGRVRTAAVAKRRRGRQVVRPQEGLRIYRWASGPGYLCALHPDRG